MGEIAGGDQGKMLSMRGSPWWRWSLEMGASFGSELVVNSVNRE